MFFSSHIYELMFLLLPISVVAFFAVSLVRFCMAKSKNKRSPGFYTKEQINTRKLLLVFSSIIFGIILFALILLFGLFFLAISYM